jgi:hypothetical protein
MFIIYLVLALGSTYLVVITPELYLQLGYMFVNAYAVFHMGMIVQAVHTQVQLNTLYEEMNQRFNDQYKALLKGKEDDQP